MSNLENNIKKEFQNREIQPSTNSWKTLSSELEVAKKPKRAFVFYKIAAVVTGLLIMLSLFLNKEKTIILSNENSVVKSKVPLINNPIKKNILEVIKLKNGSEKTGLKIKNNVRKTKRNRIQKQRNFSPKTVLAQNSKQVKEKKSIIQNEKNNQLAIVSVSKSDINNLIEKPSNTFKKNKIFMHSSDEDIDKMLADAMANNSPTNYSVLIKENNLKNVVENEILKSERHKILKVIKTGVDTVENFVVANN